MSPCIAATTSSCRSWVQCFHSGIALVALGIQANGTAPMKGTAIVSLHLDLRSILISGLLAGRRCLAGQCWSSNATLRPRHPLVCTRGTQGLRKN